MNFNEVNTSQQIHAECRSVFLQKPAKRSIFLQRWGCTIWCKNWKANGILRESRSHSGQCEFNVGYSEINYYIHWISFWYTAPQKRMRSQMNLIQYLTLKLYILDDHIWLYILYHDYSRDLQTYSVVPLSKFPYTAPFWLPVRTDIHEFPSQATSVSTAVCDQWPKPSWELYNGRNPLMGTNIIKYHSKPSNLSICPILLFPQRSWSKRVLMDIIKTKLSKIACHSASVHYWILLRFAGLSSRFESNVLLEYWMTLAYT